MSTATAPLDEAAAPRKVHNPWVIAAAVMFSTFLGFGHHNRECVAAAHRRQLVRICARSYVGLDAYLVTNAIVQPITGWLAMRIRRKNLLTTSVVGFTLASFCCGLAPTLPLLILFRLLQGAFGGTLQPLSQAVLLETFHSKNAAKQWASGVWASSSRPFSGRLSEDG